VGEQALGITWGAQGPNREDVRFAAHEQAAAVDAGNVADLDLNGADGLQVAPVGADAIVEDSPPHGIFIEAVERIFDVAGVYLVGADRAGKGFERLGAYFGQTGFALVAVGHLSDCGPDFVAGQFVHSFDRFGRGGEDGKVGVLRLSTLGLHLFDRANGGLHGFVCQLQAVEHDLFRQFAGTGFDHENVV